MNSPLVIKGLEAITARTNLATGLTHANDMNAAKAMFVLLRDAGEPLVAMSVATWAARNGWQADDANELGELAAKIGDGANVRISGNWWRDDIIEIFKSELDSGTESGTDEESR